MSNIYLVTGANRGIGRGIVEKLLLRPDTTVIAGVRYPSDPTSASLRELPAAGGSRIVVLQLRETTDYAAILPTLESAGIAYIDVVVANAGSSGGLAQSLLETDPEVVVEDCAVNAALPLRLFQSTWPLLEASLSTRSARTLPVATRFIYISSTMGSIATLDEETMPVGLSYSMSKAAANYFAKKASVEFKDKGLVVGILHPGWVKTDMGQTLADSLGIKEPPTTLDESTRLCLEQIDGWNLEKTGKFLNNVGKELPW
ncbi:aflatoxin biosynthesis ketoreductase nor-1 [Ophiostoma piceae UAMH 11346]|uniref:Aflatoxin biosynthesis ketoreductase nor-1 n=1 Tax=Ophiostoma piceae (strain UAMH 11346) TaxID=1262450 RepID=S3CAH7_OPHP1|nr:aflatoxin biosynthesis ketoreductase nor-1 [Ophiostoma piceae UAMH 11346]